MSFINIISVHYFLWFAALTSIYGYINVYAETYANASPSQYSLLNGILPFVTILAKIFFCSLADRHRAYRTFFLWFLVAALIGYGSFGILPFFVQQQPKEAGLIHGTWILICIMVSLSTISMSVVGCLSDAFAMNLSKRNNSSFGLIRVWGTLGWGVSSFLLAFINQTRKLPMLVPGLIMLIVLISIDIVAALVWPHREDYELDKSTSDLDFDKIVSALVKGNESSSGSTTKLTGVINEKRDINGYGTRSAIDNPTDRPIEDELTHPKEQQKVAEISDAKIQWILFKEVARRRKSLFRYLVLFTLSGALTSLQWSYFFPYLDKIYAADFNYISGISMVGQSILGELPFFLLSNLVIKYLGKSHTLSVSFISLGIRYLLYNYLLPNFSMYFVLLTEPFQGPSFGLFYVVLTEVGLEYSDCEEAIVEVVGKGIVENKPEEIYKLRQALRATMQSLMSACYEGLGAGIGSIIGGPVIDYYEFNTLWFWSAVLAIVLGISNTLIEFLKLPILTDKKCDIDNLYQRRSVDL